MRKGIVALLMVILVSVMGTFILVGWQARLVTAILRSSSLSDLTAAAYIAESEIYDWAARFRKDFPDMFVPPLDSTLRTVRSIVLPDDTKLLVQARAVGGIETLTVKAERQFSTTNLELSRNTVEDTEFNYDSLEVALVLDCTSSMNEPADEFCNTACCVNRPGSDCGGASSGGVGNTTYRNCMTSTFRSDGSRCSTRIEEQRKASLEFVDALADFAIEQIDKDIRLGLSVFRVDSAWIRQPGSDLATVRNEIATRMGRWHSGFNGSTMCSVITGATSIGSGFDLVNRDLRLTKIEDRKQAVVLISDGVPNTRNGGYTSQCAGTVCTNISSCGSQARNYLRCSLRTTDNSGSRDPDVDSYAVTVLDSPPLEVTNIFNELATEYFNSTSATNLSGFLAEIFEQITESFSTISIKKVIPTSIP